MNGPAALLFMVNRSPCLARVLFFLWGLGLVAMLIFFQAQVPSMESVLAWGCALLLVSVLAWRTWRGMPVGFLRWDGAAWYWSGFDDDAPCNLTLHLDFQRLLVVSVQRLGARPVWLWLEAVPGVTGWMPLRRAVVLPKAKANSPASGIEDASESEYETR